MEVRVKEEEVKTCQKQYSYGIRAAGKSQYKQGRKEAPGQSFKLRQAEDED